MAKNKTMNVQGFKIVFYEHNNADYISLTEGERLIQLNKVAISQMKSLMQNNAGLIMN